MNRIIRSGNWVVGLCIAVSLLALDARADDRASESEAQTLARSILDTTGTEGGLVVHLGCGDGQLTAALCENDSYLVHGLDSDPARVQQAREHIRSVDLYGRVSVERLSGDRLPYANNLVNLVVVEQQDAISMDEIQRVLQPGGVAYVKQGERWTSTIKPIPSEIDEWTHYLHGPDNNAVAHDTVAGPPKHIQWVGGPQWARGHEVLATISIAVTGGGRIYYISDEGPTASINLPASWTLAARDAHNGVLLWKLPIPEWASHHRPFRSGPTHLPRRLVVNGDEVFVTLGFGAPVVALNGATGEIVRTYEGTEGTEEILYDDGVVYCVAVDIEEQRLAYSAWRRGEETPLVERHILAFEAASGQLKWEMEDDNTADQFSQSLSVGGGRVFFQNTRRVVCLDAKTGETLWRAPRPASLTRHAWSVPTLVVYGDVVISADRAGPSELPEETGPQVVNWTVDSFGSNGSRSPGELIAFSVENGDRLWNCPCYEGYNSPVDVLIADGLVWSGQLISARDPGITEGRDPVTGEIMRTRPKDQEFFTAGMPHHRCYRNKATDRFLVLGRSGVEFIDLETGDATPNHFVRGTCQLGIMPANGLLYVPPHSCACYLKTKLQGRLYALAPESAGYSEPAEPLPRLEQGPAWDDVSDELAAGEGSPTNEWPMYRHDSKRSGAISTAVPTDLAESWEIELGGTLTPLVVAGEMVLVAQAETHTVHAFSAINGEPIWSFTAGGRVDSPPTIYRGRVLFGSTDGHVYCLRAADGELVWRFRAGPVDRRIVAEGFLESAWPISGSVLLHSDRVYFSAGRSSFLDGGIFLYALDPITGEVLAESCISGRDPETGEQPRNAIRGFDMPSGLPDVLSTDGTSIYMRDLKFDEQCALQDGGGTHLFCPTGFLDDSWWHRSYWVYGTSFRSGWNGWDEAAKKSPSGRLLVMRDEAIYGFGLNKLPGRNVGQFNRGEFYRLFAASTVPAASVDYHWTQRVEPEVRAMVLAGEVLYVAGPHGATHESLDAFEGREGISLQTVSTEDGSLLSTTTLDSLPVFDGMASAYGRIYLSTRDGKILCFEGRD